jgi:hypothetical protein
MIPDSFIGFSPMPSPGEAERLHEAALDRTYPLGACLAIP